MLARQTARTRRFADVADRFIQNAVGAEIRVADDAVDDVNKAEIAQSA